MIEFLQDLYAEVEGFITIWTLQDGKTVWLPVNNLPAICNTITKLAKQKKDIYFGVGLAKEKKSTGRTTNDTVSFIPGFWFDFDRKSPTKNNVPETLKNIIDFLREDQFLPSILVDSGHGLHGYWLFKEIWDISEPEERMRAADLLHRFQQYFYNRGLKYNWKFDKTADLCRILRIPGTTNYKFEPVPVKIIHSSSIRYNPDDFDSVLPESTDKEFTKTCVKLFEQRPGDGPATELLNKCSFIKHCYDHAKTLSEPYWYAMMTNISRCSDGLTACHEISITYDRYSVRETDKKYIHARSNPAPQSCEFIRSLGFAGCPASGCGVKNPWSLCRKTGEPIKQKTSLQSAAQLSQEDIPEPVWIIPGIVPTGLTFLCGRPKVGKSWLALSLALAVAYGGSAMGKIKLDSRPAIYLGLEDTKRRLKSRLELLAAGAKQPDNLYLLRTIPRADDGGLQELEQHILDTGAKLVVIDTFQLFRRGATSSENAYSADYLAAAEIKQLADKMVIGIILVHHLKKAPDGDFVQTVSGSSGITGAADTIAVLDRARMVGDAVLKITGRDVDEQELALKKDDKTMGWTLIGTAQEVKRTYEQQNIIDLLRANSDGLTPAEVGSELGKNRNTVRKIMKRMLDSGELLLGPHATYKAKPKTEPF